MLVNFMEYCLVINEQASNYDDVWYQLNFNPPKRSMNYFKPVLDNKKGLIDYRDQVLNNVAKKFDEVRDSNNKLLNKSLEVQKQAFLMRQNLELSILMSQSKKIDIEMEKLKTMNAETFIATYGL